VQKLANISGVTVRTLHHYDEIGLLKPARVKNNGYRFYDEHELLKLQQILFFRELDFPLLDIKKILDNPKFDMTKALEEHREMLEQKKKKIDALTKTIDKTIKRIRKETTMNDEELYKSFIAHDEKYKDEVKERWGDTEAYKQSRERYSRLTKEQIIQMKKDADVWMKKFIQNMKYGVESEEIQTMIGQHYESLRTFYEPNLELYEGLANMYVDDPRFTAYYEKYEIGLAKFMRDAMLLYCKTHK
jgi:DNA-binding transcriptional MerR regulator